MWEHLCVDCSSSVFGAWAYFARDTSRICPQSFLAPVTLVGGLVSVGGAEACAGCEAGHPLPPMTAVTLLKRQCLSPSCLNRSPACLVQSGSIPLECISFPKEGRGILKQIRAVYSQKCDTLPV